MNIFYNLFSIFWGSIYWIQVLKCHEDLITLETYVQLGQKMDTSNKFFICETYVGT